MNSSLSAKKIIYKDIELHNTEINLSKKKDIIITMKAENFFKSKVSSKFIINKNMQYNVYFYFKNLELASLNKFYNINLIRGNLNIETNLEGKLDKSEKFYYTATGSSSLLGNEIIINNINLIAFKKNIKKLNSLNQIKEAKKTLLVGDTNIGALKIKLLHKNEIINLPLTKLKSEDEIFSISGEYNMKTNNIELKTDYDNDNSLLSLFSINTKGKLSDPKTKLSFNDSAVKTMLIKIAEKEIKKKIKKKLEKNFDNIIENLLD